MHSFTFTIFIHLIHESLGPSTITIPPVFALLRWVEIDDIVH